MNEEYLDEEILYEDEELDEDEALIASVPKFQIFLKVLGVLILIAALGFIVYFQLEDLKVRRGIVSNQTFFYNNSCENGVCIYFIRDSLPNTLSCYYKDNKTDCSGLIINNQVSGNKTCKDGNCEIVTTELNFKCAINELVINCNDLEIKNGEDL